MYMLPDLNVLIDRMRASGQINPEVNHINGFISLEFSGNIAVIKTRNGYAAGIAYDIDVSNSPEILGTIPGSNTIFAVLRENVTHEQARKVLAGILPLDRKIPRY